MANLLAKFRIDYSDVIVIPDVTKKAGEAIQEEFKIISDKVVIDDAELLAHKEKSNRNLRLAELLREHSTNSEMVIMWVLFPVKIWIIMNFYPYATQISL